MRKKSFFKPVVLDKKTRLNSKKAKKMIENYSINDELIK